MRKVEFPSNTLNTTEQKEKAVIMVWYSDIKRVAGLPWMKSQKLAYEDHGDISPKHCPNFIKILLIIYQEVELCTFSTVTLCR